jgi:hypothetical protein
MIDIATLKAFGDFVAEMHGAKEAGLMYDTIAELEKHRKFSDAMLEISWNGQDADGPAIQEIAVECGLVEPVMMDHPCGDNCMCRDLVGDDFPVECCRKKY